MTAKWMKNMPWLGYADCWKEFSDTFEERKEETDMEKESPLKGVVFQDEDGTLYTIQFEIKAGAQGRIYAVEDQNQKEYALKQIFQFDESQIRNVMKCGQDRKKFFEELKQTDNIYYAWPLKIVRTLPGKYNCGYIMERFPLDNCVNYEQIEHDFDEWDYEELCRVSIQLCRGFYGIHQGGYCYKDVNKGNIKFDMKNQKLYIIDLDNMTVSNTKISSAVWGTPGFISPEVSRREVYPNEHSDSFSIAILLFYMWSKGHPFEEGKHFLENLDDIVDYMKNPVFIFHPTDKSNSAETEDGDFEDVIYWWNALPEMMRKYFINTFVDILEEPQKRMTTGQWVNNLNKIREHHLMKCPKCGKMIAKDAPYCGFCGEDKAPTPVTIVNDSLTTQEKPKTVTVQLMEIRENGKIVKRYATNKERDIAGSDLSEKLSKYPVALRFERYDDGRMVLRNMMSYLNWRVETTEGIIRNLLPRGRVAINRARKITLECGVSLTFGDYEIPQ